MIYDSMLSFMIGPMEIGVILVLVENKQSLRPLWLYSTGTD